MGAGAGIPVPLTGPNGEPLDSVEAWKQAMPARVRDRWDKSAREIAESWAPGGVMPPEVVELLGQRDELAELTVEYARPEGTTAIDRYQGGKRSHDLLLAGTSAAGTVVIGVEAKADEPFDVPVARYREHGLAKRADGENRSNAPERLAGLIDCLFPAATRDPAAIDALGYQLLSARPPAQMRTRQLPCAWSHASHCSTGTCRTQGRRASPPSASGVRVALGRGTVGSRSGRRIMLRSHLGIITSRILMI